MKVGRFSLALDVSEIVEADRGWRSAASRSSSGSRPACNGCGGADWDVDRVPDDVRDYDRTATHPRGPQRRVLVRQLSRTDRRAGLADGVAAAEAVGTAAMDATSAASRPTANSRYIDGSSFCKASQPSRDPEEQGRLPVLGAQVCELGRVHRYWCQQG